MEGCGIEEAERCGAVAEDEVFAVLGEAPAFAVVVKGAQKAESGAVVDEGDVRLPGELDEGAAPVGEAFGEVLAGDIVELRMRPVSRSSMRREEWPLMPVLS